MGCLAASSTAFLSPDCRYVHINQRRTEIRGIPVDGHLGRTVKECVPASRRLSARYLEVAAGRVPNRARCCEPLSLIICQELFLSGDPGYKGFFSLA